MKELLLALSLFCFFCSAFAQTNNTITKWQAIEAAKQAIIQHKGNPEWFNLIDIKLQDNKWRVECHILSLGEKASILVSPEGEILQIEPPSLEHLKPISRWEAIEIAHQALLKDGADTNYFDYVMAFPDKGSWYISFESLRGSRASLIVSLRGKVSELTYSISH